MSHAAQAARAYRAAASHRSLRQQEAEVFRLVNARLRAAKTQGVAARVKASCDNRRLWCAVLDITHDPLNALPVELRASLASVALAVRREMDKKNPDFDVLIAINDSIAAGLGSLE
jgi:flagellar biosynthesis regulator FlaF